MNPLRNMKNNINEFDKLFEDASKMSERYYGMYKKAESNMKQDMKALEKTEEEINKEFITTAYLYGYLDAKLNTIGEL